MFTKKTHKSHKNNYKCNFIILSVELSIQYGDKSLPGNISAVLVIRTTSTMWGGDKYNLTSTMVHMEEPLESQTENKVSEAGGGESSRGYWSRGGVGGEG